MKPALLLIRRLVGHELRLLWSLLLWARRRRDGVDAGRGVRGFGYARAQAALMYGFAFVCVVETVAFAVLLRPWPAVERPLLFIDVYSVIMVIGMQGASVTRPHLVGPEEVRIRRGAHVDLRVPLDLVARVGRELRMSHEKAEGVLSLDIGGQSTVTLELREPVRHMTFFGRVREVAVIHCHADEPDAFVRELRAALDAREGAGTGDLDPPFSPAA
ncbi:hypothetical protein HUT18_07195 [Streptomyces sp. NA04227]|nr:hypothetical protein HUT18_07195 [Streptomyces sp. NA04227]